MKKTKKKSTRKSAKSTTKRARVTKRSTAKKKGSLTKKRGRKKAETTAVKKAGKQRQTKKKQARQETQKINAKKSKKKTSTVKSAEAQKRPEEISKAAATNGKGVVKARKRGKIKDTTKQNLALKKLVRKQKQTPAVFKLPTRKQTPIVFSLEEVRDVLKYRQAEPETKAKSKGKRSTSGKTKTKESPKRKEVAKVRTKTKRRKLGAASISDILGFNPEQEGTKTTSDQQHAGKVPKKLQKYYNMLLDLREHVKSGLDLHTQDTLKRSSKDDTGDLSSYSQHMADAGTDNFDRDFALSLVSNEQEALSEIDEAIERIFNGTYGICEITGQQIKRARLAAVPFTRFSVQGQVEYENSNRKSVQRGGLFIDSNVENSTQFTDEDSED